MQPRPVCPAAPGNAARGQPLEVHPARLAEQPGELLARTVPRPLQARVPARRRPHWEQVGRLRGTAGAQHQRPAGIRVPRLGDPARTVHQVPHHPKHPVDPPREVAVVPQLQPQRPGHQQQLQRETVVGGAALEGPTVCVYLLLQLDVERCAGSARRAREGSRPQQPHRGRGRLCPEQVVVGDAPAVLQVRCHVVHVCRQGHEGRVRRGRASPRRDERMGHGQVLRPQRHLHGAGPLHAVPGGLWARKSCCSASSARTRRDRSPGSASHAPCPSATSPSSRPSAHT